MPGPKSRIDWPAVRDEYVTGDESLADIGRRYGVHTSTVEQHACNRRQNHGQTWGEMRAAFRDDVSETFREGQVKSYARKRQLVSDRATDIALKALRKLDGAIDEGLVEPRDLIAAAKLATAIKLEVTGGPNGAPIPITASLDGLTVDELRRLAAGP